jgi:hypothetical protein
MSKRGDLELPQVEAAAYLLARAVFQFPKNATGAFHEREKSRFEDLVSPWSEKEINHLNSLFQADPMELGVFGTAVGRDSSLNLCVRVYANRRGVNHLTEFVRPRFRPRVNVTIAIVEMESFRFAMSGPCCGGASISPLHGSVTGTLGAWLKRNPTQDFIGLSNNHVLAEYGRFTAGHPVIHPGIADNGTAADIIGTLEGVVPLKEFDQLRRDATLNLADVAWFTPINSSVIDRGIGLSGRPLGEKDLVQEFLSGRVVPVEMSGRTSPHASGEVTGIRSVFILQDGATKYLFEDQIEIKMSNIDEGDSGALILTSDRKIGGLLFAFEMDRSGIGMANPWEAVKQATGLHFEY